MTERGIDRDRVRDLVEQVVDLVLEVASGAQKIESPETGSADFSQKPCAVCSKPLDGHGNARTHRGRCRQQARADRAARALTRRMEVLALPPKVCAWCKKEFAPKCPEQRYCSRRCAGRAHRKSSHGKPHTHPARTSHEARSRSYGAATHGQVVTDDAVCHVLEAGPLDALGVMRALGITTASGLDVVEKALEGLRSRGVLSAMHGKGGHCGLLYRLHRQQPGAMMPADQGDVEAE